MNGQALVHELERQLSDSYQYRYSLYDSSGNEVNDSENRHVIIHKEASSEWVSKLDTSSGDAKKKLKYNGEDLVFGKATEDWGTFNHVVAEVNISGTFYKIGAFSTGGSQTVNEGEVLILDSDGDIEIDYSTSSDNISGLPNSIDGTFQLFLKSLNDRDITWGFIMETSSGNVYSTRKVQTISSQDLWDISNNSLVYQGPRLNFKTNPDSSFTADGVRVFVEDDSIARRSLGLASFSVTVDQGEYPYIEPGNLQISR